MTKKEKIFYRWAAKYGDNAADTNHCKYGRDLMIEFAKYYHKQKKLQDQQLEQEMINEH